MGTWGRLRPRAIHATVEGVELLYRPASSRWVRVDVRVGARSFVVRPVEARGIARADIDRLRRAVAGRMGHERRARPWIERAREAVAALATDPPVLPGSPTIALGEALAAGEHGRALALWDGLAAETSPADDPCDDPRLEALTIVAMHAFTGDRARANAALDTIASTVRDPADDADVGELYRLLGRHDRALEHLVAHGGRRVRDCAEIARLAADVGATAVGLAAAREMLRRAEDDGQRLAAIEHMLDMGGFTEAERALEALASSSTAAGVRLATVRLWRGAEDEALALCQELLAAGVDDPELQRTSGAATLLAGDPAGARTILQAVQPAPDDPRPSDAQSEAALWLARAELELRLETAYDTVSTCRFGDHPAWQLLRAWIEESADPQRVVASDTWFIIDRLLAQVLGGDWRPSDPPTQREVQTGFAAAMRRLGGNYGPRTMLLDPDAGPRWADEVQSPRRHAERMQARLPIDGPESVFAAFEREAASTPFFVTYCAEIRLWMGEYALALELFERVWEQTRTRWGYVGRGACLMHLERYDEALAAWDEGTRYYTFLDAEATHAYRGELHRRRGDFDRAIADLEHAVLHRPTRLGAWVDLVLARVGNRDLDGARRAATKAIALAPAMVGVASLALTRDDGQREADPLARALEPSTLPATFERLQAMMRGNRSSVTHTLVDDDGQLRIFPSDWNHHWRRYVGRLEDLVARLRDSAQVRAALDGSARES